MHWRAAISNLRWPGLQHRILLTKLPRKSRNRSCRAGSGARIVNAALAAASGKDAASAAAGAATGELTGIITLDARGIKDVSQLSEEQKQTVSALATLVSGLAGTLAGDSGANAIAAAQAGKTTVENNYLSDKDITTFVKKYAEAKTDEDREKLLADLKKLDVDQQQQALATGISIGDQKAVLEKLKILVASH